MIQNMNKIVYDLKNDMSKLRLENDILASRLNELKKIKQIADESKSIFKTPLDIMYGGEISEVSSFHDIAEAIKVIPLDLFDLVEYKLKEKFPWIAKTYVIWEMPRGIGTTDIYFTVWPDTSAETQSFIPTDDQITEVTEWLTYPCVREHINNDNRTYPLCQKPSEIKINITVKIKPAPGYTFAQAQTAAEDAVRNFFTPLLLSEGVKLATLNDLFYGLQEVGNHRITAPVSDQPRRSVGLPVLGTLSITEM